MSPAAKVVHNIAPPLQHLAVPLERLTLLEGNPRRGDVDSIARSYERFGQRKPVVARRTDGSTRAPRGVVIAGNHQVQAAERLGWNRIAVVWVDEAEAESLAFSLADNRTGDLAHYDHTELAKIIQGLDGDMVASTGYTERDVRDLIQGLDDRQQAGSLLPLIDVTVADPTHEVMTGDHWILKMPNRGPVHDLVVIDVQRGWEVYVGLLEAGDMLMPYPDPYITHTDLARETTMVLVQPDPYLAGHLLDKHVAIFGEGAVEVQAP